MVVLTVGGDAGGLTAVSTTTRGYAPVGGEGTSLFRVTEHGRVTPVTRSVLRRWTGVGLRVGWRSGSIWGFVDGRTKTLGTVGLLPRDAIVAGWALIGLGVVVGIIAASSG